MRTRWLVVLVSAGLLHPACSSHDATNPPGDGPDASTDAPRSRALALLPSSETARATITGLRSRFVRTPKLGSVMPRDAVGSPEDPPEPAVPLGVATGFTRISGGLSPVLPPGAGAAALARIARVVLPDHADGEVRLADDSAGMELGFALDRASGEEAAVADGLAVYHRAGPFGSDLIHRPNLEGTEDYVVFEDKPAIEELRYRVDVRRVPGLRLVSNTLEFLTDKGAPVLRVAPPYVVDKNGDRHEAKLAVQGCQYDTDPRGPWDRPVVAPGEAHCTVTVTWRGVQYPAIVDPAWQSTGNMTSARRQHTAEVLASGYVLVAGGNNGTSPLSSAELLNPSASPPSWAATGAMATARYDHASLKLSDGRVLVCGGQSAIASCERYSGSTWTAAGTMATGRSRFTMTFLGSGNIIVAGGTNGSAINSIEKSTDVYGSGWSGLVGLSVARYAHTAVRLTSTTTVFAGGYGSGALASVERYTEGVGVANENPMSWARYDHVAWTDGTGAMFVAAGLPTASAKTEKLSATGGTWSTQGAFAQVRPTTTFIPGFNWAVGGYSGTSYLASVEHYENGSWVSQEPLISTRSLNTLTKLADGRLLVAGGRNTATALASAEIHAAQGALGTSCVVNGDCLSGFCADGVCCDTACSGACDACTAALKTSGANGTCGPTKSGTICANQVCSNYIQTSYSCNGTGSCVAVNVPCDPYNCEGVYCATECYDDSYCHPNAYCLNGFSCEPKKSNGAACDGANECASGFCVDDYCCNSACTGNCMACSAARKGQGLNGTCGNVKAGIDPSNDCMYSMPGTCGLDGNCNGSGACAYWGPTTTCGTAVCEGNDLSEQRCSGTGLCDKVLKDCAPYVCGKTDQCLTSCIASDECEVGHYCENGTCLQNKGLGDVCQSNGQCDSGFCTDGVCCQSSCGNGDPTDCQSCSAVQVGFCKALSSATQCRNSAGVCDQAEYCDGSGLTCPTDSFLGTTTVCRPAGSECDLAESCTGSGPSCPADIVKPVNTACSDDGKPCTTDVCNGTVGSPSCVHNAGNAGLVCNTASNECDLPEQCSGSSPDCPTNGVKPAGTPCSDDGNPCSTDACNGNITNPACSHAPGNAGATCRAAAGICDAVETCSGSSLTCPSDGKLGSATTCRAANGVCDLPETCDGANNNCPADVFKTSTSSCRTASCSNDLATLAANCPGNSAACPDPVTQSCSPSTCNGSICGGCSNDSQCSSSQYCSGGVCTSKKVIGLLCSGTNECVSGFCADGVCCNAACNAGPCDSCSNSGSVGTCSPMPANTECRAAAGECDVAETCGGAMVCPADARKSAGTACTPDTNPCSRDICDGTDTSCKHPPENQGVLCRAANGSACDVADYCDGASLTCADGKRPSSYVCRSADGKECDLPETCTGSGDACPADAKKNAGTSCSDDGNVCTTDVCNGTSGDCQHPAGNAGTVCRIANGICDVDDTCNGSSTACTDAKRPSSFTCRPAADECDQPDTCDGASDLCTADIKKPNGTGCTDDGNPCSLDICNGSSVSCTHPAGFAGVLCRAADGPCDLPDNCSGLTTVCPDVKKPAGTTCRNSAGTCDVADTCTGTSNACPTDEFQPATLQCRDASCAGATATLPANCTGSSATCPDAQNQDCSPSTCSGTQCGGCQSDAECVSSKYCSAGVCTNKKNNAQACSGGNQCQSGFCVDGVCCNNACNGGTCDSCALQGSVGNCSPVAADTVCRPALGECDVEETCGGALTCPADATKDGTACTSDGNVCTTDVCQGTTCAHPAAPADTVCRQAAGECDLPETCGGASSCPADVFKADDTTCSTDGSVCTVDVCKAGQCSHAPGNAGIPCRQAVTECDAAEVCDGTNAACPADAPLADDTLCTADGNLCTRDVCLSGTCSHPAGNQGTICRSAVGDCDLAESCDGTTPSCPTDTLKPDGTGCAGDELPCTNDICESGLCVHPIGLAGVVCRAPASECDVSEACDGNSAACPSDVFMADATGCTDDGFFCTRDECQAGTCVHPSKDGTGCDDTNSCTQNDICSTGQCVGMQIPGCVCSGDADCNDDNACNGLETCVAGSCINEAALDCNDKNSCTTDGCDPLTGCTHSALTDGSTCNDGKYCRIGDECQAGVCTGTADRDCSGAATGACQQGVCDEPTMSCVSQPITDGTDCNDGDSCTLLDKCASGACVGQPKVGCKTCLTPADCDDGNECTTDLCDDASKQCSWATIPNCTPDAGPEGGADAGEAGSDASLDGDAKDATDAPSDQAAADSAGDVATDTLAQDAKPDQDAALQPDQGAQDSAADDAAGDPTFTREVPSCACRAAQTDHRNTPLAAAAGALLLALTLRRRGSKRTGSATERKMP